MNKRGVELTLNTVIIGILVVLVLIVIITFFLGGTAGLTRTIRGIFYGTTAGTSETLAIQTCQNRCDQGLLLPAGDIRKLSAFCTQYFEIDKNNDGEADFDLVLDKKLSREYYCPVDYPDKPKVEGAQPFKLGVPCAFSCKSGMTAQEEQEQKAKSPSAIQPKQ